MFDLQAFIVGAKRAGASPHNLIDSLMIERLGFKGAAPTAGQVALAAWLMGDFVDLDRTALGADMLMRIVVGEVHPLDAAAISIATLTGGAVRPEMFFRTAPDRSFRPVARGGGVGPSPSSRVAVAAGEPNPQCPPAADRFVPQLHREPDGRLVMLLGETAVRLRPGQARVLRQRLNDLLGIAA